MNKGQMRREKIQELSAPGQPRTRAVLFTLPPQWLLRALAYSVLLLLPFYFGLRPVSDYLGMPSLTDKYSRIDFQWNIPDQDSIIRKVEQTNFPIYQEVPRGAWMNEVFNPVAVLLEKAADLRNPEALLKYAQEQKIDLTADEAKALTDYILKDLAGGLYAEVVNPARRALDQWVYTRGVLSNERYQQERVSPTRSIEIADPENPLHRGRIFQIDQESGPVSVAQSADLVDKAFYDKLWLVKSTVRQSLASILARRIQPTLTHKPAQSEEIFKKRAAQAVYRASHIGRDDLIVQKGEKITSDALQKLRAENETYTASLGPVRLTGELVGKTGLAFFFCAAFVLSMIYAKRERAIAPTALLALPLVALAYLFMVGGLPLSLLPVGFLAGCAALGGGSIAGTLATAVLCGFLYVCCAQQPAVLMISGVSGIIFAVLAPRQRFRMGLAKAALISGLSGALALVCWRLSMGEEILLPRDAREMLGISGWENPLVQVIWVLLSWLAAFILLLLGLPLLQRLYRVTTNIRLQDLQEHPLLNKLLLEAPSTYYHSSVVSALAEAAAQACECNSLLCKTACLYHDLGKLIKPEYFTENESGISRHDALTPQMSALIIISHVKDGVEMARQWGLPGAVVDIVSQHHGTTLVSYFLRQAREQAADPDEVDVELFRYPGPRPQFKEAAVCMIADSVEAASRSLDDASPARIRSLVHNIIIGKLEDRQFDESGLNFTDLARIEDALVRILTSMFHSRVKYDNSKNTRRRS